MTIFFMAAILSALDPSHQDENKDDDEHESEAAGGTVTPTAAVAPTRDRANEEKYENDNQDGAEHGRLRSLFDPTATNAARPVLVPSNCGASVFPYRQTTASIYG
jgi:hypothetical protein